MIFLQNPPSLEETRRNQQSVMSAKVVSDITRYAQPPEVAPC